MVQSKGGFNENSAISLSNTYSAIKLENKP